jgi:Xaa-Pro dipeptidase
LSNHFSVTLIRRGCSYIENTPSRHERLGLSKLRTARTLEAGMALTNEPGCYFIAALLDKALLNPDQAKFIDSRVLNRFRHFGGVRLEDVVVVTNDGVINLTTCPRTVREVESVLAGGQWPPAVDEAPHFRRQWVKLSHDCTSLEPLTLGR